MTYSYKESKQVEIGLDEDVQKLIERKSELKLFYQKLGDINEKLQRKLNGVLRTLIETQYAVYYRGYSYSNPVENIKIYLETPEIHFKWVTERLLLEMISWFITAFSFWETPVILYWCASRTNLPKLRWYKKLYRQTKGTVQVIGSFLIIPAALVVVGWGSQMKTLLIIAFSLFLIVGLLILIVFVWNLTVYIWWARRRKMALYFIASEIKDGFYDSEELILRFRRIEADRIIFHSLLFTLLKTLKANVTDKNQEE